MEHDDVPGRNESSSSHKDMLLPMLILMFVFTYTFMSAVMLNKLPRDFNNNLNKVWMSLFMVTLMVIIEGILSSPPDAFLILMGVVTSLVLVLIIRRQWGIGDEPFLKSMIEHHSAALLMARGILDKTDDPHITELAETIITSQKAEIQLMRRLLCMDS